MEGTMKTTATIVALFLSACCFGGPDMDVPEPEWYTAHGMGVVYLEVAYADEASHMQYTDVEVNRAYAMWTDALRKDGVDCDPGLDNVTLSWEPDPIVGGTTTGRAWDLCGTWWLRVSTWDDGGSLGFVHPFETALAYEIGHVVVVECTGSWSHERMAELLAQ